MAAYKRSDPTKLRKERDEIVKQMDDIQMRNHPDSESPESRALRILANPPPRKRGAMVIGTKKQDTI